MLKKKILIWLLLSVNLLFAFIVGLAVSSMISESRPFLGIIVIPLLLILNYVYLDRFHYLLRVASKDSEKSNDTN